MPLPDRFIDDHLVEMLFPLFDQARLQLVDVTNLAAVHMILQLPLNLVVDYRLRSGLLAGHRAGVMKSGVS